MLELPDITLLCVDCYDIDRALVAIRNSTEKIRFGDVKLLTSIKSGICLEYIKMINIEPIKSVEDYSEFMIKRLNDYVDTKYVLVIQWDGYVKNPDVWTDEFLEYDYIGAPWHHIKDENDKYVVGNGGFSLRSKRLIDFIQNRMIIKEHYPEDVSICLFNRKLLVYSGFKFAPIDLAYKFSIENEPYKDSFGWHGEYIKGMNNW